MTFDAIQYLMEKLDRAYHANRELWEQGQRHKVKLDHLEGRVSSLEQSSARFSQVLRIALPLLVLVLAGLAILGPTTTAKLLVAMLKLAT